MNVAEVIDIAEDLDVSGAVSPFERPNLGPWLTDPTKIAQWDVLVVWKMDRLSRSALDTLNLLKWAQTNGKRIVAVSDSLDSDTSMGRAWISFAAIFAEMEREAIMDRINSTRQYQRLNGLWSGGNPPYGTRPKKTDLGYVLEEDPETAPVLREIVERTIAGESRNQIARDLNERGVPTARKASGSKAGKDADWYASTIRNMLRNFQLRGFSTYQGHPVIGPDGQMLRSGPELITADEWEILQLRIQQASEKYAANHSPTPAPLYGVVLCQCGAALVGSRNADGSRRYLCPKSMSRIPKPKRCGIAGSIRADIVEPYTERNFLALMGNMELVDRTVVPGKSYAAERREVEAAIARLDAAFQAGAYEGDAETYAQMRQGLRRRLAELSATPDTNPSVEDTPLGITYRTMWDLEDTEGRRKLILGSPFRVIVGPRVRRGRTTKAESETRLSFEMMGSEAFGEDFE